MGNKNPQRLVVMGEEHVAKNGQKKSPHQEEIHDWCRRRDSNPHTRYRHKILSLACLPIPPLLLKIYSVAAGAGVSWAGMVVSPASSFSWRLWTPPRLEERISLTKKASKRHDPKKAKPNI